MLGFMAAQHAGDILGGKLSLRRDGHLNHLVTGIFYCAGFVHVDMTGIRADRRFIRVAKQRRKRQHVGGSAAADKGDAGFWALAKAAYHIRGGGGVFVFAVGGVLLCGAGAERF